MHSRVVTRQFSKKPTSTSTAPERSSLGAHQSFRAAKWAFSTSQNLHPMKANPWSIAWSGIFKQGGPKRGGIPHEGEKYDVRARGAERHRTVTQVRLPPSCSWSIKLRATFAWRYGVGAQGAERHRTVIRRGTWLSFPLVSIPPVYKYPTWVPDAVWLTTGTLAAENLEDAQRGWA